MEICQKAKLITKNYGKKVNELLKAVEGTTKLSDVNQLFTNFSKQRTMIPELWLEWLELETKITFEDFDPATLKIRQNAIKAEARKQFFHYEFVDSDKSLLEKDGVFEECLFLDEQLLTDVYNSSMAYPINLEGFEFYLSFPNLSLNKVKNICERYGTRPISSKSLKNFQESSEKLEQFISMSKYKYVKDWKENLAKFPNKHFAINSFECFLGIYPGDRHVWKFYAKFLKDVNNVHLMLHTYSRYCRLYPGDIKMRRNYIDCIAECHNKKEDVYFWWTDAMEIENIYGKSSEILALPKFANYSTRYENSKEHENVKFDLPKIVNQESIQIRKKPFKVSEAELPSPLYFSPENAVQQLFSFPYDVINDIRAKCNFAIRQKLNQSCKFFYQKSQQPLCHRLGVFENSISTYFNQSLFLNSANFIFPGLDGAVLTNSLQISLLQNPNATSIILSNISECHILFLELKHQNLTEAEFDKLVGNHRIQDISLRHVNIENAENELLTVEQILAKIPNAFSIALMPDSSMFTPETAESMSKLVRPKNIKYFYLSNIPNDFNEICFQFFVKNAIHSAGIFIAFEFDVNDDFKKEFYRKGKKILDDKVFTFEVL